jgi:hypothetical protein
METDSVSNSTHTAHFSAAGVAPTIVRQDSAQWDDRYFDGTDDDSDDDEDDEDYDVVAARARSGGQIHQRRASAGAGADAKPGVAGSGATMSPRPTAQGRGLTERPKSEDLSAGGVLGGLGVGWRGLLVPALGLAKQSDARGVLGSSTEVALGKRPPGE